MNQQSLSPQVVCFGEILWDVLPHASLPGGAPMNVAFHLKKLGVNPALISRTGRDNRGEALLALLQNSGIITHFIQNDEEHETGWVHARQKAQNEMEYDIVQPVAYDFIGWDAAFKELLSGAAYFVFGSLAARSESSRNTLYHLLEAAPKKVLDINLRPPHYNRALVESLLSRADILKLNEAELEIICRWYAPLQKKEDMMRHIQDRFSIPTIIATLGSDGAIVLQKGQMENQKGYQVPVADTIGSGDAFLAGFLSQLIKGASIKDALETACRLGALIATYNGACPDYTPTEIESLKPFHPQTQIVSQL